MSGRKKHKKAFERKPTRRNPYEPEKKPKIIKKRATVYVLKLDNAEYLIHFTTGNIVQKLEDFTTRRDLPEYLKKYHDIQVITDFSIGVVSRKEAIDYCSIYAVRYMAKVGYQNVRGGKFMHRNSDDHKKQIEHELDRGKFPFIHELESQFQTVTPINNSEPRTTT